MPSGEGGGGGGLIHGVTQVLKNRWAYLRGGGGGGRVFKFHKGLFFHE